jgi:hypothetical protein
MVGIRYFVGQLLPPGPDRHDGELNRRTVPRNAGLLYASHCIREPPLPDAIRRGQNHQAELLSPNQIARGDVMLVLPVSIVASSPQQ